MSGKVTIHELWRSKNGQKETLHFKTGVNLIVGDRNTGKTKWLETLDYLMGDEVSPQERGEDDIFKKYSGAGMRISVAGKELQVERQWAQVGLATKVVVDGKAINLKDYRELLIGILGIPIVRYPQGNPFGPRTWPELSWRSLYRHVYRRQHFWNDLADQQPDSEQHASLLQFLGVVELVFSDQYSQLVETQKKITQLETQKEQFLAILNEVTREILNHKAMQVAVTPASLDTGIQQLQKQVLKIHLRRETLMHELAKKTAATTQDPKAQMAVGLSDALIDRRGQYEANAAALNKAQGRLAELREYRNLLGHELERLKRAHEAGSILVDLKVTHCPACDQELLLNDPPPDECRLCRQPLSGGSGQFSASGQRLAFEIEQIESELSETEELLDKLSLDVKQLNSRGVELREEEARIETNLRPLRSAASALLPPEVSVLDIETGRKQEQIQQLERIKRNLDYREILSTKVTELEKKISQLEGPVEKTRAEVDYHHLSDEMTDGFNTYLNRIQELKPGSWAQKPIRFRISDKTFNVKVGDASWQTKLGGTLTLYFLLAYHYALLRLTERPSCRYPGLAVIDFPAELPDKSSIADHEDFLIQPFVELLNKIPETQLIVAGSAFSGLEQPNRLELKEQWT